MSYEVPSFFHDLRSLSSIRKTIRACQNEPPCRAVTALLRIRYEQHETRSIDPPMIRVVAIAIPLLLLCGALVRPSLGTFALVFAGSVGWWLLVSSYNIRYPHRDERDIPERQEIDGMVRLALERICEAKDLQELELTSAEKKQILALFAGQPLPSPLRQAVLRQVVSVVPPDV